MLCLSLLIVFVGNSSLNVAIPTLSRELHATESQLQWVVAIYSLVFAGLLFSTGALGDRFGRKGALQLGLLLFLVGAGLASQSTAMGQLIACRAVMGAAGALIMPSTLSIIINVFPAARAPEGDRDLGERHRRGGRARTGRERLAARPLLVRLGVPRSTCRSSSIALVAGQFLVPKSRDPEEAQFDPVGAVLSIIGIVALVYGLIEAPRQRLVERRDARPRSRSPSSCSRCSSRGSCTSRADARHALLPATRRSARAPAA